MVERETIMEIKSGLYIAGILFALAVILTTTECKNEQKTDTTKRPNNKVIGGFIPKPKEIIGGFIPKLKENHITILLNLVLNEADLVKMAAHKKLLYLYEKQRFICNYIPFIRFFNLKTDETSDEIKLLLAVAMIRSTTELIKYYSVGLNPVYVNVAMMVGLDYCTKCYKIQNAKAQCHKWKAILMEAYVYRHKHSIDFKSVETFKKAFARAKETNPDDNMLNFLATKVACEVKLMVRTKGSKLGNLDMWYKGIRKSEHDFDCVPELLKYENEIENVGSYLGEYYYLLGRAYAKQNDNQAALECLAKARQEPILCQKTRSKNKKVQELYESLYVDEYKELKIGT